jgi:RimJ/RimL family protein N-acetyltransferase
MVRRRSITAPTGATLSANEVGMTTLETERLTLRRFTDADRAEMIRYYGDPAVMGIRKFGPRPPAAASAAFDTLLAHWHDHGFGLMAGVERATGAFIGEIGLRWNEPPDLFVEISYGLYPPFRGKGYATEASAACLALGFETLGLERIVGRARGDNTISHRVLEKLGMTLEFRRPGAATGGHDLVQYAIERAAWLSRSDT